MQELISPTLSETLVLALSVLASVAGAWYGLRVLGARGLMLGLVGALIYGLWQAHKYVTRYDPQTEYFGLDKVNVLLWEVVAAVVLGATLGVMWSKITRSKTSIETDSTKDSTGLKTQETEDNGKDLL